MKTLNKFLWLIFALFSSQAFAQAVNPHGTWETDFGLLYLYYYDNGTEYVLEGEYYYTDGSGNERYGVLRGDYDPLGGHYEFEWVEVVDGSEIAGLGYFDFPYDGLSFTGGWTDQNGGTGLWNGTKISDDVACFTANQSVTLSDFSQKNLENLQAGEQILSYNPKTQTFQTATVKEVEIFQTNAYFQLTIMPETLEANATAAPSLINLNVTAKHPIQTTKGFRTVENLKIGDKILLENGATGFVQNMHKISTETLPIYNLKTEGKAYFINGVLVLEK